MTKLRRLVATITCVFLFLFGLPVGQFDTVLPAEACCTKVPGPYGDCYITDVVTNSEGVVIQIFMICF